MNSAWENYGLDVYPVHIQALFFIRFEPSRDDDTHVVHSIVDLVKSMGLELSAEDVEELVDNHSEKLTTEELQNIHLDRCQMKKLFQMRTGSRQDKRGCILQR